MGGYQPRKPVKPPVGPSGVSRAAHRPVQQAPFWSGPDAASLMRKIADQHRSAASIVPIPEPFRDWGSSEVQGPKPVIRPWLRSHLARIIGGGFLVFFVLPLIVGLCAEHPLVAAILGVWTAVALVVALLLGRKMHRRSREAELIARMEDQDRRWIERGDLW